MNQIRLLPILVVAISALLLLKSIDLFTSSDLPVNPITAAAAQNAEAESEPAAESRPKSDAAAMPPEALSLAETPQTETLILQRLGERRSALEKRAVELDLREQLLNAAQKRVENRVSELKAIEGRIQVAEKNRDEHEANRLNGLVQMYENMKPKDAARVFDRLSLDILVEVVLQMKPRKMSPILAKMSPEAAEKLTVALATDRTDEVDVQQQGSSLPKIEGTPTN